MSEGLPDWLRQPLLLEPYLRPMPWGGTRLAEWLARPASPEPIGEAWLVSDHPLHFSRIVNIPEARISLRELVQRWPAAVLGYPGRRFPLLVKLIDARDNLSVQVHPDDTAARVWAPQEGGKTEAWLVLDADPQGTIYLGLKPGITREVLQRELPLGTLPLCLKTYPAKVGQCYFVPAGTVHALGAGVCVLEVQQTSDATFRLYDWGRVDASGKPRPLHIEAGLAVLHESTPQAGPTTPIDRGNGLEELVQCPYFTLYRLHLREPYRLQAPVIVVALSHSLNIAANGHAVRLPPGHAALLPACAPQATLTGDTPGPCCLVTWPATAAGSG
jgi:mannose-6-phosphate isomerase